MKIRLLLLLALLSFSSAYAQQYALNGDAVQQSCNCYLITEDLNGRKGSVWNVNQIDLNNSFDFTFDVFLGYNDVGADGIAFVLQPISTSVGSTGGGLGYEFISPSLAVEIDTYHNSDKNDPTYDHVAIQKAGDPVHGGSNNLAGPVAALSGNANIEDGQDHLLRIVWDVNTSTLDVYMDGDFKVSYTGDIVNDIFAGDGFVYWGFTGSTGGQRNEQRFCLSIIPSFSLGNNSSFCSGAEIQIVDESYSGLGNISSWQWDFGNGETSNQANPLITYGTSGGYNVTQIVTDQAGCSDTTVFPIVVEDTPDANLFANDICLGDTLGFTDQSTVASGNINSWQWHFGDGDSSGVQNPIHVYDTSGTFMVSLVASTQQGCSDSTSSSVEIFPLPIANSDYEIDLLDVTFINTSSGATDYLWIFPDSSISSLDNPQYSFPDTGHYPVTLIATSANGCTDTIELDVYLNEYVKVEVPNVFTPDGDGKNETWRPTLAGTENVQGVIYDRWGIRMISFDGASIAEWDGRTNGGKLAKAGTYFYHLNFNTIDGKSHNPTGTITLIR